MKQELLTITRRDFVKTVSLMGAALAVPLPNTLLKSITPQESEKLQQAAGEVTTHIIPFGLLGSISGNIGIVHTRNGRILRITPLDYTWKYTPEQLAQCQWTIEARGRSFTPRLNSMLTPHGQAYKQRAYSPNRVGYPLKRVDWTPLSAGGPVNEQGRGISPFVRISWDEAINTIAAEIVRIKNTYGTLAIACQT